MAKSIYESENIDLKKPIPEEYKPFIKDMQAIIGGGVREAKRMFWGLGRYVKHFMEAPDKYGKNSIENMEVDLNISKSQLYNYAAIFSAYDEKALERVCARDKVIASAMIFIAKLPTEEERDQAERRVQGAEPQMSKQDIMNMVNEMAGDKKPRGGGKGSGSNRSKSKGDGEGGGGGGGASTAEKKSKQLAPKEFYEMHTLAMESILEEAATTGAQLERALKPQIESLPKDVRDARKEYVKQLEATVAKLTKLRELMVKNGL